MAKVLLIDGQRGRYWTDLLRRAVLSLEGSLTLADQQQAAGEMYVDFDVIILDASLVDDLVATIRTIRTSSWLVRIIVVSPTPRWKQARETLLAGGTDYVKKVHDETELLCILQDSLSRAPAPRWSEQGEE